MKSIFLLAILFIVFVCKAQTPSIHWQYSYGGSAEDRGNCIKDCPSGGFVVLGSSESTDGNVTGNHGYSDFWLLRLDSNGLILWQKCYGGSYYEFGKYVECTSDGGFILMGTTDSDDGQVGGLHGFAYFDFWIIKIDNSGNIQWQKCYGGTNHEWAYEIHQTLDGGYIAVGESWSADGDITAHHSCNGCDQDIWVVKIDALGNIQWEKSLGGTNYDLEPSCIQLNNGQYMIFGGTESQDGDVLGFQGGSDAWLVKLDTNGSVVWQRCYGGSNLEGWGSFVKTSTGFVLNGGTISSDGDVTCINTPDMWVWKIDSTGTINFQQCFGGSGTDNLAREIIQTQDTGFVVYGHTNSPDGDFTTNHGSEDFALTKMDSSGGIEWSQCYGGSLYDWGQSIVQTSDGGYVLTGYSNSNNGDVSGNHGGACPNVTPCYDLWVTKLYPEGMLVLKNDFSSELTASFTSSTLHLKFTSISQKSTELHLIDITGRNLFVKNIETEIGENNLKIPINEMKAGIYFVRLENLTCKVISF